MLWVALAYFATAQLSLFFRIYPAGPSVIWIPAGLTTALVILTGRRYLLGIALGAALLPLTQALSWPARIAFAIANVVEPVLCCHFLSEAKRFHRSFDRLVDSIRFVFVVFLAPAVGASIAALGCGLGAEFSKKVCQVWFDWWIADFLSMLLISPAVLVWSMPFVDEIAHMNRVRRFELVGEAVGFFLLNFVIFYSRFETPVGPQVSVFALYLNIVFPSLRWPMRINASQLLFTASFGFIGTLLNRGPFIVGSPVENMIALQLFVASAAIIQLILNGAITQYRKALLEAKMAIQVREDFLSIASHELKTPIASLKLAVQFLRSLWDQGRFPKLPREQVASLFLSMDEQIERFTDQIEDLLDVGRLAAGQFKNRLQLDVDLSAIVQAVADRFRGEALRAKCSVRLDLDSGIIGVWDPAKIEQVVANLLSNALKYGAGRPVEISVKAEDGCAELKVRDYGIGISKENQARIFKRFERATSIKSYGGIGLGLYITKEIVDSHNGEVSVESRPGLGSTFKVRLPLVKTISKLLQNSLERKSG